jgi:uncharacterized protein (UPF0548 family)
LYSLQKPTEAKLQALAKQLKAAPLSTPKNPLGEEPQHHWYQDQYRREIVLPNKPERAKAAIEQMMLTCDFLPSWMVAKRVGDIVIVGATLLGVWGIFADRVIEEHSEGDAERFDIGFTYATVQGHFETGVESFRATRASAAAPVVFEIKAISRASNPFKQILSEVFVRGLQKRFGHDAPLMFEKVLLQRISS